MSKKLRVFVLSGQNLAAKKKGAISPYCEVTVFDEKGDKACASQTTKVIKDDQNPSWEAKMSFMLEKEPKAAFTLQVRCWDKHTFRKDKFLGQFTVTFNSQLVSSSEAIENSFNLASRNAQDSVSGSIKLKIQYGDLMKDSTQGLISSVAQQLGLTGSDGGSNDNNASASNNNNNNNAEADGSKGNSLAASVDGVSKPPDEAVLPKSALQQEEVVEDLVSSGKAFFVHEEDQDAEGWERYRDGPPVTRLEKIGNANVAFSQSNLQVKHSSNSYTLQPVKADVVVHVGKWYYEVKLESNGQAQLGWCTADFDNSGQRGDYWAYDGNRMQKIRNGNGIQFGQSWSSGDIIGVFLTLGADESSLKFSRNGHLMGQAYGSSELGKARSLSPFVMLSRNMRMTFNFGATPFKYPQHDFNLLHCFLNDKQLADLAKLFNKYCHISNDAVQEDEDFEAAIFEAGTDSFMTDLGITDDLDPGIFIVSWKLQCIQPWVISKAEWMNYWALHSCSSLGQMKEKLAMWRSDLENMDAFSLYYNWVFDLMRGDKRILDFEQVKILWQVVGVPHADSGKAKGKWPLLDKWLAFLEKTETRAVNQDLWAMVWEFAKAYPNDISAYDVMDSAYPAKLDDFCEFLEEGG